MIKELVNRLLCSMFDSCIVTFGMIVERFAGLTAIAIIIDIVGFGIVMDAALQLTWYNVVIAGILVLCIASVVALIIGYLLYLLSELRDSSVLKLDIGYYSDTSSGKLWNKTIATCRKYGGN